MAQRDPRRPRAPDRRAVPGDAAGWPSPRIDTSANPAAPSPANGPAGAMPAASGTRSSRSRSTPVRGAEAGRQGSAAELRRAAGHGRSTAPRAARALRSWIACWAAGWSRPRPCWWAAIPASANRPCCCRRRPRSPGAAGAYCTSRARSRSTRSGCAPAGWAWRMPSSTWRRPSTCATSGRRWKAAADAAHGGHRLHPDHVDGQHRLGARDRQPGARLLVRTDPAGEIARLRAGPGGPRHQGRGSWPGRACWSTWWMRCCISRAIAATSSASCAA